MEQRFFIDLEGTVIDEWSINPALINIPAFREFIRYHNVRELEVFSFAVWDDTDCLTFDNFMKKPLEEALGVPIKCEITQSDLDSMLFKALKCEITSSELGKERTFLEFARSLKSVDVLLVDDVISDSATIFYDIDVAARLINVKRLQ